MECLKVQWCTAFPGDYSQIRFLQKRISLGQKNTCVRGGAKVDMTTGSKLEKDIHCPVGVAKFWLMWGTFTIVIALTLSGCGPRSRSSAMYVSGAPCNRVDICVPHFATL